MFLHLLTIHSTFYFCFFHGTEIGHANALYPSWCQTATWGQALTASAEYTQERWTFSHLRWSSYLLVCERNTRTTSSGSRTSLSLWKILGIISRTIEDMHPFSHGSMHFTFMITGSGDHIGPCATCGAAVVDFGFHCILYHRMGRLGGYDFAGSCESCSRVGVQCNI